VLSLRNYLAISEYQDKIRYSERLREETSRQLDVLRRIFPFQHEWRYELKLDGFRAIGHKSRRGLQLWSRNQKDFLGASRV